MGTGNRIGVLKVALILAVGAAGGGAALAVASVPDTNGATHACVAVTRDTTVPSTNPGNVRIIDPSAGQSCNTVTEQPLDFNVTGPQGAPGSTGAPGSPGSPGTPGTPGPAGQSVTIAGGHTLTIAGGQVITVGPASGGLTIAAPTVNERGRRIGQASFTGNAPLSFDVLSVGFAATTARSTSGARAAAGKVSLHDLAITKKLDKASPRLSQACASGKHFPTATITLRKAGKPYLAYELSDVLISSYQLSTGAGSSGVPLEHLTLSFAAVKIKRA